VTVCAPEPLAAHHVVDAFDCGTHSLNDWLRQRGLRNPASGASRTFVACDEGRASASGIPSFELMGHKEN